MGLSVRFSTRQALGRGSCYRRSMKQAIFFERDGILNVVGVERQQQVSPLTLDEFRVNEAIVPLLSKLKAGGFLLIATTNQPGLSRGYQSRRELDRMHELLQRKLLLDDILVCPHDQTDHCPAANPTPACSSRRPSNGTLTSTAPLSSATSGRTPRQPGRPAARRCSSNPRGLARCITISCCRTWKPLWTRFGNCGRRSR